MARSGATPAGSCSLPAALLGSSAVGWSKLGGLGARAVDSGQVFFFFIHFIASKDVGDSAHS